MTLPGENKSKFSFTSFISKAYSNAFGVAVSYASTPYNSFSNAISGIYNFNYKQCFVSKFYGSSEMSKNIAHNAVINILKIIPPLNGYFSCMSKAKAEQEVDIKLPDPKINDSIPLEENIRKLSVQIGFSININTENTDSAKSPEEGKLDFEWIIVSEENAGQLEDPKTNEQQSNSYQLLKNNVSPFEGWGASHNLGTLGPPPKLYSGPSRVDWDNSNQPNTASNLPTTLAVVPNYPATSDQYIFHDYCVPVLIGASPQEQNPNSDQDNFDKSQGLAGGGAGAGAPGAQ